MLSEAPYKHDIDKKLVVTMLVENSLVFTVYNEWLRIRPDVPARHQVSVFTPLMLQQVAKQPPPPASRVSFLHLLPLVEVVGEVKCYALAQRSPPIMDACKQGSEKTIYALVMDLSSAPLSPNATPPSPLLYCMSARGGNNSIHTVVVRYFDKNQHVFSLIITQTKLELLSDRDT